MVRIVKTAFLYSQMILRKVLHTLLRITLGQHYYLGPFHAYEKPFRYYRRINIFWILLVDQTNTMVLQAAG